MSIPFISSTSVVSLWGIKGTLKVIMRVLFSQDITIEYFLGDETDLIILIPKQMLETLQMIK